MDNRFFRIGHLNANGLNEYHKKQFLKLYLDQLHLDVLLISETHFNSNSVFRIPNFTCYHTPHPDNRARGGSAVIIKNNIDHFILESFSSPFIQATSISVKIANKNVTISAVYSPPKHSFEYTHFLEYLESLGQSFISGGDFNAKHHYWSSRLNSVRGRRLKMAMDCAGAFPVSSPSPTHWPVDLNKIPDVLDFFICKGISENRLNFENTYDSCSDHSLIVLNFSDRAVIKEQIPPVFNSQTDWDFFRRVVFDSLNNSRPMRTVEDCDEAIDHFYSVLYGALRKSTPEKPSICPENIYPLKIRQALKLSRQLRHKYQNTRNPADKTRFNNASSNLTNLLVEHSNRSFEHFLSTLSYKEDTNYSLYKASKSISKPRSIASPLLTNHGWARSPMEKSLAFAEHLSSVFKPLPSDQAHHEVEDFISAYNPDARDHIKFTNPKELRDLLKTIKPNKAPGKDRISARILRELPPKAFAFLASLFNACIRLHHFPTRWKLSVINMILKPGKNSTSPSSYRPISLLSVLSKLFEKVIYARLIVTCETCLPDHQFGFRKRHSTIQQVHRLVNIIEASFQNRRYCTGLFLDLSQAFDRVWHEGLLFKISKVAPEFHLILKSYLSGRSFLVAHEGALSCTFQILSGVPQGSILGPLLYLIYTHDIPLPTSDSLYLATFADDSAILSVDENPDNASTALQDYAELVAIWFHEWKLILNETKSVQVTFSLKNGSCPPVAINGSFPLQEESVKYLGVHLDRRLTWKTHISKKRSQIDLTVSKFSWLLSKRSKLSVPNKLQLYKSIIRPIWSYASQLWSTASPSNIKVIQTAQNKCLRSVLGAPWYVRNDVIHASLGVPLVIDYVKIMHRKYLNFLEFHPNHLAVNLLDNSLQTYRLQRRNVLDVSA